METDRQTLIDSLKASKGWTTGYAEAFVDTFVDRAAEAPRRKDDEKWSDRFNMLAHAKSPYGFDRYPYIKK